MKKNAHTILGIHIQDRIHQTPDIQKLFTQYGCNIRVRLGLHEAGQDNCSAAGIILLETIGDDAQIDRLTAALDAMDGIEVQKMVFGHE